MLFVRFALSLILGTAPALADESGIDPSKDLMSYWSVVEDFHVGQRMPDDILHHIGYADKTITIDSSQNAWVDSAGSDRIFAASLDYENYVDMGMPNLVENKIVERLPGQDCLILWTHMINTQHSKHYMKVCWDKVRGGVWWFKIPKEARWPYEEDPAFVTLRGSFYLTQISTNKVYMRYFMQGKLKIIWPDWAASEFVKGRGRASVGQILSILAQKGQIRQ